ncbi:MAG: hypothetical protein PHV73_07085, partial [Eubacteriales bacterium]|nr:hypothetical protein [Eubacteriales bacterium]
MKKRMIMILVFVLVLALSLMSMAGCDRREGSESVDNGDKLIIGGAMSVTGIQGPLDSPAMEGIELAVAEVNAAG